MVAYRPGYSKAGVALERYFTPAEKKRWRSFLRSFPVAALAPIYKGDVDDGTSLLIEFHLEGKQTKRVFWGGAEQPDLRRLMQEINKSLPPQYQLPTA